jgi:hypothetical protein
LDKESINRQQNWQTFILLKVITALKNFTSLISQKSKKLAACSSVRLKEVLV